MIDGRRTKNDQRGSRRTDSADLSARKLDRALTRVSVIRRSSGPAADMGEWIIDELEG
jgi:hypothetical protein